MFATFQYVLLTSLRDKIFAGLYLLIAALFALALFLGEATMVEGREAAIVYAAAGARFFLALGVMIFVSFHVQRLHDTREIEAILSRPLSRPAFALGYWAGLAAVAALLVLPVCALLFFLLPSFSSLPGFFAWSASLLAESFILVAFAFFASVTLVRGVVSVLIGVGFYLLARLGSFFLAVAEKNSFMDEALLARLMEEGMRGIAYLLPRLDLFAQTEWLVHNVPIPLSSIILQTVVYVLLLLAAAMVDLSRKRF